MSTLSGFASGAVLAALLAGAPAWAQTEKAASAINEQVGTEKAAVVSQQKIDKIDDETRHLLDEYRLTLRETDSLRRYNDQLSQQVKSQEDEMVSIQKQIVEIERTNREIMPLMQKMVDTLDQFVKLDLPFLSGERAKRVQGLKDMMTRADVTTAEKYRRILEAYSVEMEYGRTLETYEDKIPDGKDEKTVDVLRIGRVSLLYQTLDGGEAGYWNAIDKKWEKDNGYKDVVRQGLKLARKQGAPELLIVPVQAAAKENK